MLSLSGYGLSVPLAVFLCVSLVDRSCRIVAPLAPCLCSRFPSLVHVSLMRLGVSPCVWFRKDPWGVVVAPPISPYTRPGWSPPICRVALELKSVFLIFPVRHSTHLHGDHFVSFPDSCVSIPHIYLGCSSLNSCLYEWLGGLSVPLLSLPGFCHLRGLIVPSL